MNSQTKKVISGIAKTSGKYTLKGLGKGLEFAGRGAIKTVNALVKNPQMQKIATGAGLLAASVMIPAVGVGLISAVALKYMFDNSVVRKSNGLSKKNKGLLDEISDILKMGNVVTQNVSNKILSPTLSKMDRGVNTLGNKYQDKVDDLFK